jgi:hypothetical protein
MTKSAAQSEPTELLALRAPVEFWQHLDQWRSQQIAQPSRPASIRWIVWQYLQKAEARAAKQPKRKGRAP